MQTIKCDCGAELPFQERDLSAAAGKPFTCPICGKTRKLPLANVFAPATLPEGAAARSALLAVNSAGPRQFLIWAAVALTVLILWAGPGQALRVTGLLIASAAAAFLMLRAVQRDSPQSLVGVIVALLGGIVLYSPHWSSTAGLAAIAVCIKILPVLKIRRMPGSPMHPTDQLLPELGKDKSP